LASFIKESMYIGGIVLFSVFEWLFIYVFFTRDLFLLFLYMNGIPVLVVINAYIFYSIVDMKHPRRGSFQKVIIVIAIFIPPTIIGDFYSSFYGMLLEIIAIYIYYRQRHKCAISEYE